MNTLLKRLGWGMGIAVLLLVLAALIVPLLFDANDFKDEITAQVEQQTGRKLTIEGDLDLSLFPWIGVKLNHVKLDNPPAYEAENFAESEQIAVRVKLLPLLKRHIELDTVALYGLRLNLERNQAGQGNWEAILGPDTDQPVSAPEPQGSPTPAPVTAVSIDGIDVRDGQISWYDRAAGQRYTIKDFALETGAIAWGQPFDLASRFQLVGSDLPASATVELAGQVQFDPAEQTLALDEIEINGIIAGADPPVAVDLMLRADLALNLAEGTLRAHNLNLAVADLQAPAMGIDAGQMTLQTNLDGKGDVYQMSPLRFDATLSGEALPNGALDVALSSDARLDLGQQTLNIDELSLRTLGLQVSAKVVGEKLLTQPQLRGSLTTDRFSYRKLLQQLGQPVPQTTDPGVLDHGMVMIQFTASPQAVRLDPVKLRLDDSQLTGNFNIMDFAGPTVRFQLALDAIDVDRYLPPPEQTPSKPPQAPASAGTGGSAEAVSLQQQLDVKGQLRIGRLTAANLKLSDIRLPVEIGQGQLSLDPLTATLYQGSLRSAFTIDGREATPRFALTNTLTGIQAAPLLKDLLDEDRLSGTAQMTTRLRWRGTEAATLIPSLNGTTQFTFENGAVKGVNLGRLVREAKAALAGRTLPPEHRQTVQTDFSILSGSVRFAEGKAINNDLQAKSPLLRVRGRGTADLSQEQLDYLLTATVVASAEGQGGEDLAALKGIPIPIRVSGPFAEPRYTLDVKALLKARAERLAAEKADVLKREAEGLLQQQLEKLTQPNANKNKGSPKQQDKARELLKKLF